MDAQLEMHTKQRWVFNDRGQEQSHFPSRHESQHKYSDDKLTGEAQYNNSPQCCQIIFCCSVDIFAPATVTTPWRPCLHLNVGKTQRSITYGRKDPAIFWKRFLKGWKICDFMADLKIVNCANFVQISEQLRRSFRRQSQRVEQTSFLKEPCDLSESQGLNQHCTPQTDRQTEGQRQARCSK